MAQPVVVSSCINYKWEYDVFLSFHGEDTRLGFVGFLRESLRQRGIHVFYDDDSIRIGEEITPALFKAIQESRIAIIVFSENYANSTFCLQELEKILEFFIKEGRLVYPVFYYVDPSELRRPRGSYAKALAGLEERFKDDKQKVEKWRWALSQTANLKGCHLKSKIAKEQEYIAEIINEVSARIIHNHLHVTQYPVGLVSRVKEVVSLLDLWSTKENKMVGLVGAGGIGKSTIARAVYNSIADHFEGLCFLFNVRKESKMPNGLAHLQETLLYKLVMEKDIKLGDFYEGIPIIKHRLGHTKILLILDDVDELEQLEALAGSCDWFGPGSRIVITTRNKQLLVNHDVNNIYNVTTLNDEESLQLLSWYAFKKENVEFNFTEVSKSAILYSCGYPLAIEVIGSNLRDKGVDEWHSALDQYKIVQEGRVFGVLRLSYDSLAENEKQVFLDLACFCNGVELGEVMDILLCLHGIQPKYAIGVLIDKSLVKIEDEHMFMHDLIEDMGKEIVRQESPCEPGERSRLWCYEDILHVLEKNIGTNKVEVIVLDLPGGSKAQIQWCGKAFMKMKNLKMLVINNASFSTCPAYLPKSLRWLKWKGYPFKILPDISSTELFCLDLSCSSFDTLQPFTKTFHSLSRMNFRNCKSLQEIPDLSGVSNLRELWLDGCTKLVEIHHSIGHLNKLKELSAMRCNNLEILPPNLWLTSLEQLNLFGCSSLSSFPDILVEMKYIQTLDIGRTGITTLPSSMRNLIGLETLNMEECPYLEQLPTTIYLLPNLWQLNANCSKLMTHFKMCEGGEENLGCYAMSLKLGHFCFSNCNLSNDSLALCLSYFATMIRLDLSFNKFTTLPACIKECHHLRYLLLDHCKRLQHIEEMPPNLEKFSAICCKSLTESSKSKVLYQALNLQTGKTNFILPGHEFPENLDNYSRGSCVSFWVRDVFPTIFLWIVVKHEQDFLSNCTFLVHVNDTKMDISFEWHLLSTMKMGHLCICDLQSMIHKAELLQGNRWNHVKVSIKSNTQETKIGRDQFDLALHVSKQQKNSDTIRFMDPRTVYVDSNSWQRVQKPQDGEELKDDMPNRDLAMASLKAQHLSKEALKVKQVILPSRWTYDVFLSYESGDECYSFVRHLHNSLCKQGVHAFDNDELGKTSWENLKALQESRTAIIVISKNYAFSPSCLNSLAIIHECFRMECRLIYPIFYDVEPLELQYQTGSYGEVFARLEKIFKQHVQKWRLALSEIVDSRSTCHLTRKLAMNATEDEDVVQLITHDVSRRIGEFPFHIESFSVRLKSRVHKVISLADIGSNDEVKMVGICGSRICKSTMARALCNSIARHFEDLWYFHGVQEIARGYVSTWDDFQNQITQPWFPQRKILVILDGVEVLDQLEAIRECDRFGGGSRIIVVTSDKQLLVSHGVEIIYDDEWNSTLDEKGKNPKEEEDLKAKLAVLPSGWSYDVFLSYRAGDECSSFVRRLYHSLCQRGVRAFYNDELGRTGRKNLKALQESRTVIIVISKNYASSPSCLNSLATIHECFRKECRFIYPIFYDVEPLELRHQTGSYGEVFTRLRKMFKHHVQKWRLALFEVANSRGMLHLNPRLVTNATEDEDIVQLITYEVSARIEEFPFHVEYFSVRLESQVQKVISLVDIWSNEEVKMVGLCGDRIRRSTMARAVCNSIACHFEDLWYFSGVSSSSILPWTKNDLSYAIKMKLPIYEITRGYGFTLDDFHNLIRQPWFPQKKILVILDGDEVLDQLGAVRECDQFGEGSRVIVVTSDKQWLVSHGVEIIYDVERNSTLDEKGKNPKKEVDLKAKLALFPSGWSYDVFLSYNRGDDKCSRFVRHLNNSLCQQGVHAFHNDDLGKTSWENLKALQESRIAIIVISKNYAFSPSCLNSLAIIHECFRMECRLIYPIFYDVEPLELQYQTGSYEEVFARLEKIFKQHVQKWRLALSEVANSGVMPHLSLGVARDEGNAIKWITREVYARLAVFPLSVWDFSVGLESHVQKVISLVDIGSNEEVKMVGICGIRKSAIAHAVCNVIARHFEDLWYFHGVTELARCYASTWDDFQNRITQPWFPLRKILVILDGVELLDQLGAIRDCDRFGEGSRIIVVIRDKQLLISHGVEIIYDDEWNSALDEKGKNLKEEEDLKAKRVVLPYRWTYDVFLSYRGDDACSSFVRHLYYSLCQLGVHVLVNDELVEVGWKNFKALRESRTIIIVTSKNYGSSSSLSNIIVHFGMDESNDSILLPYNFASQRGSYSKVFSKLGKLFQRKRRLALSKGVNIEGMHYYFSSSIATKDDENAIKWITGEIYARLAMFPLSVWDFSVGLESRIQKVISLVDIGSNEEVRIVGICGIRKSAIARAVCNIIARHFEHLWYFHGFHEIVGGYTFTWNDFLVRLEWLQGKDLVILEIPDGAGKRDDFWEIRRNIIQFGEGSRIIVTASDKDWLVTNGIKIVMDEIEEDPNDR